MWAIQAEGPEPTQDLKQRRIVQEFRWNDPACRHLVVEARKYMEAEVESTCGHQWRRSPSGTTAGTDYRNRFVGDEEDDRRGAWDNVGPQHLSVVVLCDIISEARIRDGKVKMPGMTHMHVLHMEGRGVLGMRQHLVPQSPTMRGLVGKLDALDPPGGSDSDAVLLMEVREGLKDAFRTLSVEAVRARVAALLEQLAGEVFRLGARASERGVWSYRLWDGKELEVMRSRNQGELEDWKELRDGVDMADVVRGIRSGREPVFFRVRRPFSPLLFLFSPILALFLSCFCAAWNKRLTCETALEDAYPQDVGRDCGLEGRIQERGRQRRQRRPFHRRAAGASERHDGSAQG